GASFAFRIILPDMPNWSWHEYGMRVGFWRLRKMLGQVGAKPTVTLKESLRNLPRGRRGLRRKRLGAQRTQLRPGADAQARRSARDHHKINGHHRKILGQATARLVRPGPDANLRDPRLPRRGRRRIYRRLGSRR